MIVAAAACPHPPLLLRELTGRDDVAAGLRVACLQALAAVLATGPEVVVVVGGGDRTQAPDPGGRMPVWRYGGAPGAGRDGSPAAGRDGSHEDVPGTLPLSVAVGRRLLAEAGCAVPVELHTIAQHAPADEVDRLAASLAGRAERVALLVLGEGSARRGEKAPGYLDARAFDFDAALTAALQGGDLAALRGLDPALAAELMVSGRAPWAVLAAAVQAESGRPRASLEYADDPFGVLYLVATWLLA
ncbi:MAG TPA: hypothetical protein VFM50_13570 [Nocardioidaceae bacterium]|nr:hypothetical protein [Nocardioidaceae bacterium]